MKYLFLFTTFRHLKRHKIRTILTIIGIALGVAIIVAIDISNRTTFISFRQEIDKFIEKIDLKIVGPGIGFSQEVVKEVKKIKEVEFAVPIVSAGISVIPKDKPTGLWIWGIEPEKERLIREYEIEKGKFLTKQTEKNSILISSLFAKEYHLKLNDNINLVSEYHGILQFRIIGILKNTGVVAANGGYLALIRLDTAQVLFDKEGLIDVINIKVKDGINVNMVKDRIRNVLPKECKIEEPKETVTPYKEILKTFQTILSLVSVIALGVGMFMIYNTMSIAVTQRRREIGILRALGVKKKKILLLFIIESATLGLIAAIIGLLFGVLLSKFIIRIVAESLFITPPKLLYLSPNIIILSLSFGIISALLSGLYPAYESTRVSPLLAIQRLQVEIRKQKGFKKNILIAFLFFSITLIFVLLQTKSDAYFYGVVAIVLLGAGFISLSPFLIINLSKFLEPVSEKLFKTDGKLAILNIIKNPYRIAVTVCAVTSCISMTICVASLILSFKKSATGKLGKPLFGDIIVYSKGFSELKEEFGNKLRKLKGVDCIGLYNFKLIDYKNKKVGLSSLNMEYYERHQPYEFYRGNIKYALREFKKGKGILASTNLVNNYNLKLGDKIKLDTPSGIKEFKLVGITIDYTYLTGNFLISRETYKKYFKGVDVDAFDILLKPNYNVAKVKEEILKKYGDKYYIGVYSDKEIRENIKNQIEKSFAPAHAIEVIAIIIAVLGILNTLLISTFERTREIGVLRAVGSKKKQILKMVIIEAVLIGLFSAILGIISGLITSYILVCIITKQFTGWVLKYTLPYLTCIYILLLAIIFAILAAYYPAKKASNTNIIEALQYE